ncbi:MAG: hypothetical protein RI911_409 [Candidatus Parcubacteria bacterium]|jgi:hypothetical protein
MVQKKVTKTQARYIARAQSSKTDPVPVDEIEAVELVETSPVQDTESVATEVISIAPLLDESGIISETLQAVPEGDAAGATAEVVHTLPTSVPIQKKTPERTRNLIKGEPISFFVESLRRERIELIDALCGAGFNHNRFALGNDGYAEEVRHEVHTALKISEWSVTALLERKEYGYRAWKDIAEEVAQVAIVQKDVLTDTLFDAIIREVRLYPSAGTKDMVRRALIDALVMRTLPATATESLADFIKEVMRVYFTKHNNAPYSPFEYALISSVYAYYGDTPPNTVSHEVVHSGGWSGLKKTLLKGGGTSTVDQYMHSPKSTQYALPDIATLTRTP